MNEQLKLRLATPDDHGEGLHPSPRHGTVILWQRLCGRRWIKIEPADDMARILSGQRNQIDRFIGVNEFHRWRLVKLLKTLRACYVDLDGCSDWHLALDAVEAAGLPQPGYLVLSGRGVHLYWLLEATPSQALPLWQALQKSLIEKLTNLGADRACADSTRVLRLVGTRHGGTGAEVVGFQISPQRWQLNELAGEVLGGLDRRSRVTGIERAKAKRAVARAANGTFALWHRRYADLCLVADHHAFMRGGISEGSRDRMLFLLANALSWFTRSETLADEIERVAQTYTPTLTLTEVRTYTAPILKRARASADGHRVEFQGEARDPRYYFRTETLRHWLGDLLEPVKGLRVLVPRSVLRERKLADDQARISTKRREAGVPKREAYLTQFEDSQNAQKPWEALGIHRATYFRRKAKGQL